MSRTIQVLLGILLLMFSTPSTAFDLDSILQKVFAGEVADRAVVVTAVPPDSSDRGYVTCTQIPIPPELPTDSRAYNCTANYPAFYAHDGEGNNVGEISNVSVYVDMNARTRVMRLRGTMDFYNGNGGHTQGGSQSIAFTPSLAGNETTRDPIYRFGVPRGRCHYAGYHHQDYDFTYVRGGTDILWDRFNFRITRVSGVQTGC